MRLTMIRSLVARVLIVTITSAFIPSAEGAVIGTEALVVGDRDRILMLLQRPDVAAQLEVYGVKVPDAKARVAALSDAEAAQLSDEIDKAYAGAGGGDGFVALLMVPVMVVAVLVLIPFFLVGAVVYAAVTGKGSAGPIESPERYRP